MFKNKIKINLDILNKDTHVEKIIKDQIIA